MSSLGHLSSDLTRSDTHKEIASQAAAAQQTTSADETSVGEVPKPLLLTRPMVE